MLVVTLLTVFALGFALGDQMSTLSTEEMKRYFSTENPSEAPEYAIVYVEHVNSKKSRHVTAETIADVSPQFQFKYGGKDVHITLRQDDSFLAPDLTAVRVLTDNGEYWEPIQRDCLYRGYVTKEGSKKSSAQISTCSGMMGSIYRDDDGPLFIEPLNDQDDSKRDIGRGLAHLVYRRRKQNSEKFCTSLEKDTTKPPNPVPSDDGKDTRTAKHLTMGVVGDKALYDKKGGSTSGCLTGLMNSVTHGISWLGLSASVHSITVVSSSSQGPTSSANGVTYLQNLASWAKNQDGESNWDVVALLTGSDIHGSDGNYNTLGIAYVNAVCDRDYRTSVSEMRDYSVVDVQIHETGHNLGCEHDSEGNSCPSSGYMMAAYVNCYYCEPSWSSCSQTYYSNSVGGFNCL